MFGVAGRLQDPQKLVQSLGSSPAPLALAKEIPEGLQVTEPRDRSLNDLKETVDGPGPKIHALRQLCRDAVPADLVQLVEDPQRL